MKNLIKKIKKMKTSTVVLTLTSFTAVIFVLILIIVSLNKEPGKDIKESTPSLQSSSSETSIESEAEKSSIVSSTSIEESSKEEISSTIISTISKASESVISKTPSNPNSVSPSKAHPSPSPTQSLKSFDEKVVNTLVVGKMKKLKGSTSYKTNIIKPASQMITMPQNLKTEEAANLLNERIKEILNYSLYLDTLTDASALPYPFDYDYYLEFVGDSNGNHVFKLNYRLKKQYAEVTEYYNTDEVVTGALEFIKETNDPNYSSFKAMERFDGQSKSKIEPYPILINMAMSPDLDAVIQTIAGTMSCLSGGYTKYDIEYYGKFLQGDNLAFMFNLYLG